MQGMGPMLTGNNTHKLDDIRQLMMDILENDKREHFRQIFDSYRTETIDKVAVRWIGVCGLIVGGFR